MKRPQRVRLNDYAVYVRGTGGVVIGDAVVVLSVVEEELFELLLRSPRVPAAWAAIEEETGCARQTVRAHLKGLRTKLGARAVKTHHGRGLSLQPQFVGAERVRLAAVRKVG